MAKRFTVKLEEMNTNEEYIEFLRRCSIEDIPYVVQERILDIVEEKTSLADLAYKVTDMMILVSAPVVVALKINGKWVAYKVGAKWKSIDEIKNITPGLYCFQREVDMTILDTTSAQLYHALIKDAHDEALLNGLSIMPIDYFDSLEWRLKVAQKLYDDGVIFYEGGCRCL